MAGGVSQSQTITVTTTTTTPPDPQVRFLDQGGNDRGSYVAVCDGRPAVRTISAGGALNAVAITGLTVGDAFGTVRYVELTARGDVTTYTVVPFDATDHNGLYVVSTLPAATGLKVAANDPVLHVKIVNAVGKVTSGDYVLTLNGDQVTGIVFVPPAEAAYSLTPSQKFKLEKTPVKAADTLTLDRESKWPGENPVSPGAAIPRSHFVQVAVAVEALPDFGDVPAEFRKHVPCVKINYPSGATVQARYGTAASDQITILKVDIAMDGNRDDSIDFDDPADIQYLFWVNDDYDVMHWEEDMWHEDDDPSPDGASVPPNWNDDYIGETEGSGALINPHNCRRDLEDFARIHIRVDDNTASMSGITYFLKFENVSSGSPAVNIFSAVDETLAYLQNGTVADQQIQETKLITVGSSEVPLPNGYIKTGNQVSPFILEGRSAGKGDLTIIVKRDGNPICRKAVTLELRPITKFYQVFRVAAVGQNSTDVSAGYNPDFATSDDYLLIVHGFNLNATDKTYWPGTAFKRLWWQGYKGHVGFFDWPCDTAPLYDSSEFNAWRCGAALLNRVQLLRAQHSGNMCLLAHSQGNVVTGEALRLATGQVADTYIATQAAVPADCYQSGLPSYVSVIRTPNVFANYPQTGTPYLADALSHVGQVFSYYNQVDWALTPADRISTWEFNNGSLRPYVPDYGYVDGDGNLDTYNPLQGDNFIREETTLVFPGDTFEIFSYGAQARAEPVGVQSSVSGFSGTCNLRTAFNYDARHYSHSREFRSNVIDERQYWGRVMLNSGF